MAETTSGEIIALQKQLVAELDKTIKKTQRRAKANHLLSLLLMICALACTVSAGIFGLMLDSPKEAGALATLPPLIALVASSLKLEPKSSWHYRKLDILRALRRRLLYQAGPTPSAKAVSTISREWTRIDLLMQRQWDTALGMNWTSAFRTEKDSSEPTAALPPSTGAKTSHSDHRSEDLPDT